MTLQPLPTLTQRRWRWQKKHLAHARHRTKQDPLESDLRSSLQSAREEPSVRSSSSRAFRPNLNKKKKKKKKLRKNKK